MHVCTKCLWVNMHYKKNNQLLLRKTKEGSHGKRPARKSKGADKIFSGSRQKATAGKAVEDGGSEAAGREEIKSEKTLQVRTIVGLNKPLIEGSTKEQRKSQKGLRRWGATGSGTKKADSHSPCLTRYIIKGNKQNYFICSRVTVPVSTSWMILGFGSVGMHKYHTCMHNIKKINHWVRVGG